MKKQILYTLFFCIFLIAFIYFFPAWGPAALVAGIPFLVELIVAVFKRNK
jgi:hypothetical protein